MSGRFEWMRWPMTEQPHARNTRIWDFEHGRWTYYCDDDAHVWACDHAATCQCGKVTRQVVKCAVCEK